MSDQTPYNPLEKRNLALSIVNRLMDCPVVNLGDYSAIRGSGVYALYYSGDFAPYRPLIQATRRQRFDRPIYVGKAIPKGGRKGGITAEAATSNQLRKRLQDHFDSISETSSLSVEDFQVRALTVDDIWIPLGEHMLIDIHAPLWNVVVDGFGNHDPGGRRATQHRSPWDVLHPGRAFAKKLATGPTTRDSLIQQIRDHFTD